MGGACPGGTGGGEDQGARFAPALRRPEDHFEYKQGTWYTCSPDGVMPPRLAKTGAASQNGSPASTLPQMLEKAAKSKGAYECFKVERPCPPQAKEGPQPPALPLDQWATWTFLSYYEESKQAAKGFISLGFEQFDSVNIWGYNSPEWMIAAMAAGFAGGKTAGLYPTDTGEIAAFKTVHSAGSMVVLEDQSKLKKLLGALNERGDCKRIKAFVTWGYEPPAGDKVEITGIGEVPVIGWKALLAKGKAESDNEMNRRVAATLPGHCAGLIYTSGTTGDPKAVMMSHDNFIFTAMLVSNTLKDSNAAWCREARQDRIVSYLPLSHVAGMLMDILAPMCASAELPGWATVYFARPYDLKAGTIKDRLCAVRPTMFLGVPLVWEKIADKLRAIGANTTGMKKAIADTAKSKALARAKGSQLGGDQNIPMGYNMAVKLLDKVKEQLGLDCCRFGLTGAAPIRVDTQEYFASLNLQINETYGMSESCGSVTICLNERFIWGSVGFALPSTEVKAFLVDPQDLNKKREVPLAPSADTVDEQFMGELCFRGRSIMMGYLASPDLGEEHVAEMSQKTAETIDNEGWLHSGDKGMVTVDGMVKITGRYKEIIIGEGGENIAPVPIEDHVKKECDGICEIMMVGDKRKYNVALVTLKAVGANGEQPGTDQLDAGAKRVNPDVKTISGAMKDPKWVTTITAAITSANNNSKCCMNAAFKIQKFTILPTNFSEDNNELTPTKKLKRKIVEKGYADVIEKLYATDGVYIAFN